MHKSQPIILIIDDIPLNAVLLEVILRPAGYLTYKAYSGREGRNLAIQVQPSLILLDITMPEEDGVTTCRILKADPRTRDIPVIFLSAHADEKNRAVGFANGAADYITKPFERTGVLTSIAHLLTNLGKT